ncbi:MAG TPA: L,D-transpeptidase [Phycisphaerae bacterium]|nr:L,D-transpeptidase [Phycisphaerae bacterium]
MLRIYVVMCLVLLIPAGAGCRTGAEAEQSRPRDFEKGAMLPEADWNRLQEAAWNEQVGDRLGLWVSVTRQELIGIRDGRVEFTYVCSTAEKGVGNRENSYQTPRGWHLIDEKIGEGLPAGAVLVSRRFTGEVWKPGSETTRDMVLSRIMWLRGLEPGVNRGTGIDSHDRFIYIHGTPAENRLGTPASMGCVRLSNADTIELYELVRSGTRVLISEW